MFEANIRLPEEASDSEVATSFERSSFSKLISFEIVDSGELTLCNGKFPLQSLRWAINGLNRLSIN